MIRIELNAILGGSRFATSLAFNKSSNSSSGASDEPLFCFHTGPLWALATEKKTNTAGWIERLITQPQHTLSTHPLNTPYQHTLSTHPLNTPYQHTLSTHPINTPYQPIPSTHPINTPSQHTLSTHPINPPSQQSPQPQPHHHYPTGSAGGGNNSFGGKVSSGRGALFATGGDDRSLTPLLHPLNTPCTPLLHPFNAPLTNAPLTTPSLSPTSLNSPPSHTPL